MKSIKLGIFAWYKLFNWRLEVVAFRARNACYKPIDWDNSFDNFINKLRVTFIDLPKVKTIPTNLIQVH